MNYVIISEEFALSKKEYKIGISKFGFAITADGRFFCDVNSLKEFPEIFEGINYEIADLKEDDFIKYDDKINV